MESKTPKPTKYHPNPISPRLITDKTTTPRQKKSQSKVVSLRDTPTKYTLPVKATAHNVACLDLGNQHFNDTVISQINPKVASINLSSISFPLASLNAFKNIRTLYLEGCKIKSLVGFPQIDELRYLSLANNKLSDFNGLPMLINLEKLNIGGNPIDFPNEICITAIGSIHLSEINGRNISEKEIKTAFNLSPLIGFAIRNGRDVAKCSNEANELKKSREYLTSDLKAFSLANDILFTDRLELTSQDDGYVILLPYKASNIKWFKNCKPEKGNEWAQIASPLKEDILPLTIATRMHIIKCEFSLLGKRFAIYTDQPIGREIKDLCLPFPIDPQITGIPDEGSLISLVPLAFPARVAWTRNNETISKDTTYVLLSHKDVGFSVACLIKPYCPRYPSITFATVFTATDIVTPIFPTVTGIVFPSDIIEGNVLCFMRNIYPEREGQSEISIERAFNQSAEWISVCELSIEDFNYTPLFEDVGCFLRISYIPVTPEGIRGEQQFFYSESRVLPAFPMFKNQFIAGLPRTSYDLCAIADYIGGRMGESRYTWFISDREIEVSSTNIQKLKKIATNTKTITITQDLADLFIAVEMIPIRDDEVIGEPVYALMKHPITVEEPPEKLNAPQKIYVGQKIEFDQSLEFMISDYKGLYGFSSIKTGQSFTPRMKHVGKLIRVANENVDMIIGEVSYPFPSISSVTIKDFSQGVASIDIIHKNVSPERLDIVWFRIKDNKKNAIAIDTPDYVLTKEDLNCKLQVLVTLYDISFKKIGDHLSNITPAIKKGDLCFPEIIGDFMEFSIISVMCSLPIKEIIWYRYSELKSMIEVSRGETYTLTKDDVDCIMKANVAYIINNDGQKVTSSYHTMLVESSKKVERFIPEASVKLPRSIVEGQVINPIVSIVSKHPDSKYKSCWYRINDDYSLYLSNDSIYKVKSEDIDHRIIFHCVPYASDGITKGKSIIVITNSVKPKDPIVCNVVLSQSFDGYLVVEKSYSGGNEGKSFVTWEIQTNDRTYILGKTAKLRLRPPKEAFRTKVTAILTPVRSDNVQGKPVRSNTIIVKPLPIIVNATFLLKDGLMKIGNPIICNVESENSESLMFQWFKGMANDWKMIEKANTNTYTPTEKDIGLHIMCSTVAINSKNWESEPTNVVSQHTMAKENLLEIICDDFCVGTLLRTNIDDDQIMSAHLIWQEKYKEEWKDLCQQNTYLLTSNDIGKIIRVRAASGIVSKPTEFVILPKTLDHQIKAIIRAGTFRFRAESTSGTKWGISVTKHSLELMSSNGHKKIGKWPNVHCNPHLDHPDQIELWVDPSTKYILIPDFSDDQKLATPIDKCLVRDFMVVLLRKFAEINQ